MFFFSSLKLQYRQTIVLLNKLKLFKETSFSKATMACDFPPRKTPVAQKHRAISLQEKMAFSTPGRVALGLPSPSPRVCTDGRMDGRTLTSQPKFFASIHYQFSLAMELRWRALPAGSAITSLMNGPFTTDFPFPLPRKGFELD